MIWCCVSWTFCILHLFKDVPRDLYSTEDTKLLPVRRSKIELHFFWDTGLLLRYAVQSWHNVCYHKMQHVFGWYSKLRWLKICIVRSSSIVHNATVLYSAVVAIPIPLCHGRIMWQTLTNVHSWSGPNPQSRNKAWLFSNLNDDFKRSVAIRSHYFSVSKYACIFMMNTSQHLGTRPSGCCQTGNTLMP